MSNVKILVIEKEAYYQIVLNQTSIKDVTYQSIKILMKLNLINILI